MSFDFPYFTDSFLTFGYSNDGDDCAWSLSDDGWATGTNGELLLYVPPVHRPNLYRPRNTFIFGEGATQLDLRELKHLTL